MAVSVGYGNPQLILQQSQILVLNTAMTSPEYGQKPLDGLDFLGLTRAHGDSGHRGLDGVLQYALCVGEEPGEVIRTAFSPKNVSISRPSGRFTTLRRTAPAPSRSMKSLRRTSPATS